MKNLKKIKKEKIMDGKFFIKNFLDGWNYVKESRKFIYFVLCLFLAFALIGAFISAPSYIVDAIKEFIKKLLEATAGLNIYEMIAYIFWNNLVASFFGLFLGAIICIPSIIICVVNGYVLGYVAKATILSSSIFSLWRIFPHGIFELPAVFISLGLGIKLGMSLFFWNADKEFLRRFFLSIKVFFFIVLPLLVVAAIIEGVLIGFIK
jgi:stage II sporulation protein M